MSDSLIGKTFKYTENGSESDLIKTVKVLGQAGSGSVLAEVTYSDGSSVVRSVKIDRLGDEESATSSDDSGTASAESTTTSTKSVKPATTDDNE